MSYTINVYSADANFVEKMTNFLASIDIFMRGGNEFVIEVKEMPQILSNLRTINYKSSNLNSDMAWMVSDISNKGITLLVFNLTPDTDEVQANIFIPTENIVCIHSLTTKYFDELKKSLEK